MIDASNQDAKAERIVSEIVTGAGRTPQSSLETVRATSPKCSLSANGMTQKEQRRRKRRLRKQRRYQADYRERKREAEEAAMRAAPDVFDVMEALSPEENRAISERVDREGRERDTWKDRLHLAKDQRGIVQLPYWFQVYAEQELRVQGIGLEEQRAVDYTLDVLMPRGPMNDERPWYEMVHA